MLTTTFSVQSLWPLAFLVAVAVIIPVLLSVFKLKMIPSLVVEIIAGIIIAVVPFTRNLFATTNEEGFFILSNFPEGLYIIGMSIMLFMSGFESDFSLLKKPKKDEQKHLNVVLCAVIIYILVIALSIGVGYLMKAYIKGDLIIGIAILAVFFSSTFASLVVPLVHDYDLAETTIGQLLACYSTISELCSIIALSVIMILLGVSHNPSYIALIVIIAVYILIFIVKRFIKVDQIFGKKLHGIVHLTTRVTILILLLAVLLSDMGGVEYILGAFLSGMIIKALWPDRHTNKLETIGYGFFVPLFYILVGVKVGLFIIDTNTGDFFTLETLLLFGMTFVAMILVRLPFLYLLRYYKCNTVIPSLLVTTSTIIVAIAIEHISKESGLLDEKLAPILIIISLITCLIPPIFFANHNDFSEARLKQKDYIVELSDFDEIPSDH